MECESGPSTSCFPIQETGPAGPHAPYAANSAAQKELDSNQTLPKEVAYSNSHTADNHRTEDDHDETRDHIASEKRTQLSNDHQGTCSHGTAHAIRNTDSTVPSAAPVHIADDGYVNQSTPSQTTVDRKAAQCASNIPPRNSNCRDVKQDSSTASQVTANQGHSHYNLRRRNTSKTSSINNNGLPDLPTRHNSNEYDGNIVEQGSNTEDGDDVQQDNFDKFDSSQGDSDDDFSEEDYVLAISAPKTEDQMQVAVNAGDTRQRRSRGGILGYVIVILVITILGVVVTGGYMIMRQQLDIKENENRLLSQQKSELSLTVDHLQAHMSTHRQQNDELLETIRELTDVQEQNADLRDSIVKVKDQYDTLKKTNAEIKLDVNDMNKKFDDKYKIADEEINKLNFQTSEQDKAVANIYFIVACFVLLALFIVVICACNAK